MSAIWRLNDEPPQDFTSLLYYKKIKSEDEGSGDEEERNDAHIYFGEEEGSGYEEGGSGCEEGGSGFKEEGSSYEDETEHDFDLVDDEDKQAISHLVSRDRSRSPLFSSESASASAGLVIRCFDEDNTPKNFNDGKDIFYAPDTHALYVSPEERERNERNKRCVRGLRSGRRGGRRGRESRSVLRQSACGHGYPNQGKRGSRQWELGHPLCEIWTCDEDVPHELVSLATDVMRSRQMRMQDDIKIEINVKQEDASESQNDDDFFDASSGADDLPRLENQNLCFEWYSMDSFQGHEENFRPKRTGSVYAFNSAYDAFRSYWGDDVLDLIVTATNLYATTIKSDSFQSEWIPTNTHEILCLFSFWMMLGIVKMPTITSCFSVDPLLKTEVFRRIFSRRRYELLNRALHFLDSDPVVNNPTPSTTSARSFDRLHRLRPIITYLNSRFQSNYILSKDICLNESLTLWNGSFKQYICNKASKYGIKTFELCESTTGYLWSFIVYSGNQSSTDIEHLPGVLKSIAIVKKLIGPLLNKGYRLFLDNWYNSPLLARFLKLNGTDCVGTLRSSCRDVPSIVTNAPLNRGQFVARHSGDVTVLSWQDMRRVTMISTCHGASTALPTVSSRPKNRPVPFTPQMVLDYNKFMGGVDLKDQTLEPYLLERKRCAKWYLMLFKCLLNVSILNSHILLQSSTHKHQDHLAFRLQLVDSILTNHLPLCPRNRRSTASISRSTHQQPDRFIISTHWPVLLEPTQSSIARNRNFTKRCVVCLQNGLKSQRSAYCCESCRVPLCIKNCFKSYHTPP